MRTVDDWNDNNYRSSMQQDKRNPVPASPASLPKVASEALFGVGRELVITHNGRNYRLRVTRSGKLILTA